MSQTGLDWSSKLHVVSHRDISDVIARLTNTGQEGVRSTCKKCGYGERLSELQLGFCWFPNCNAIIIAMLCTVCSTLINVKSTLDDVKVVIFRNFFARCYRNMRGAPFFFFLFFFFLTKKCKAGRLADCTAGETLLHLCTHSVCYLCIVPCCS